MLTVEHLSIHRCLKYTLGRESFPGTHRSPPTQTRFLDVTCTVCGLLKITRALATILQIGSQTHFVRSPSCLHNAEPFLLKLILSVLLLREDQQPFQWRRFAKPRFFTHRNTLELAGRISNTRFTFRSALLPRMRST